MEHNLIVRGHNVGNGIIKGIDLHADHVGITVDMAYLIACSKDESFHYICSNVMSTGQKMVNTDTSCHQ